MELDIKPVIVTALFDIGRDKWTHHTQSYGGYLDWMERTLSIQNPMVIFTEKQFEDRIRTMRDKYFDKTHIVIGTKEETMAGKLHYENLSKLMSSEEFKKKIQFQVPEMLEPWYNIMMFNKLWWMKEASELIEGTHYIWTDAACYREDIKSTNIPFPTKKIGDKPIFFSHHDYVSIADIEHHSLSQMRFIQGGSLIVPKEKLQDLCVKVFNIINRSIHYGYIGSDEKIFDLVYLDSPDNYQLVKCGWREYMKVMS
jgi:hypothetical protein